jgi:hypothetical protein
MSAVRTPSLVSPQLDYFGQKRVVINTDHASCHNAAVHPNAFALWGAHRVIIPAAGRKLRDGSQGNERRHLHDAI